MRKEESLSEQEYILQFITKILHRYVSSHCSLDPYEMIENVYNFVCKGH